MKKIIISCFAMLLILSACDKNVDVEGTEVTLNFKGLFNGAPVVMNQDFVYPLNGKKTQFSQVYCYVSNIQFINEQDVIVDVKDVDIINFTNINDIAAANAGVNIDLENVPLGKYKAIRMSLGVSSELNKTNPQNAPQAALQKPDNYWDGWQSYIFAKIEGRMDIDDIGQYTRGFTYHTGGDDVYQTKEISHSFEVTNNNKINFTFDLAKALEGVNIATVNGTHNIGDQSVSTVIMQNLKTVGISL